MSKIFTHLAGGLNISAGFSPIAGAPAAEIPLTHTLEDRINWVLTRHLEKQTFMPIRWLGPNFCYFWFLSDFI